MPHGSIVSINVSDGGVPKHPIPGALATARGVEGDRQRDQQDHGGPDRAVCIYSAERIEALQKEGHPIVPGSVGENVTIEGIDWDAVVPGRQLRLGQATVEVTSYTVPCRHIRASFIDGRIARISQMVNPGWSRVYAKVLTAGEMATDDAVELLTAVTVQMPDGTLPALSADTPR